MPGEFDLRKRLKATTILIAIVFNCAADDSRRAPFPLPPVQTARILSLFEEQNLSLEFVFQQQPQTDGTLLRVVSRHGTNIFEVASSTVHNYIKLTFKLNDGFLKIYKIHAPLNDGLFHRIIVTLDDGELRVVDNCRIIFNDTHHERIDGTQIHGAKIFIANDPNVTGKEIWFEGNSQEFSAVAGDPISNRCVDNLETMIDNPVLKETAPYEENTQTSELSDSAAAPSIYSSNSVMDEGEKAISLAGEPVLNSDSHHAMTLHERIGYLERQMNHWNTIYDKYERRIKQVELHLRGCNMNGLTLKIGERHRDPVACTECQCSASGKLHCGAVGCPKLECLHPIRAPGSCCPQCGKKCYFNGNFYENGMDIFPKKCVRCVCNDGNMLCQHKPPAQCPVLECPDQVTPPNECCTICRNVDYCDNHHNPCHVNATCKSGEYSATCTCKTGFFGNGSSCYDIDECLWDEDAREQLGGCQTGTICINLPGSFKCDCLPGFQKLDERSCLDIIRI